MTESLFLSPSEDVPKRKLGCRHALSATPGQIYLFVCLLSGGCRRSSPPQNTLNQHVDLGASPAPVSRRKTFSWSPTKKIGSNILDPTIECTQHARCLHRPAHITQPRPAGSPLPRSAADIHSSNGSVYHACSKRVKALVGAWCARRTPKDISLRECNFGLF